MHSIKRAWASDKVEFNASPDTIYEVAKKVSHHHFFKKSY